MSVNKKRKSSNKKDSDSKKRKSDDMNLSPDIDPFSWVSASRTRNYMLKDPLLDWLAMYGEQKGFIPDSKTQTDIQKSLNFGQFIMKKGVEFESYIVSLMKNIHGKDFHEVDGSWIINKIHRQIKDTVDLMKDGAKIIYQGLVFNPDNKTWGYPDLIVRSDFLNKLTTIPVISEEKSKKGCRFSDEWHYRIIDIKYTTLKMKVDEKSLLNNGSILPYKAQTYIYNRALGYMQNLVPRKAYLLGRGWNSSKNSVQKPFDKLGQVDFVGDDKDICEESKDAVEWVINMRKNGMNWNVLPSPTIPELYPNMCNDSNNDWGSEKKTIASELKEITSVWNCGVGDREICHGKNVYKWSDPKCSAELMNKGGKINPPMINKILEVNREDEKFYIDKNVEIEGWKRDDNIPSFFIDFESISNINNIRASDEDGNIFMIGSIKDSNDEFQSFTSSRLTHKDEKKIIEDFVNYITSNLGGGSVVRFYHYSFAEPSLFKKALQKYNIECKIDIRWIDLLDIVRKRKFVVKGALDFSLKSIVEALSKNEMIDLDYKSSEIGDGSSAMVAAFLADSIAMKNSSSMIVTDLMKSVQSYNKIDCVVLKKFRDLLEGF